MKMRNLSSALIAALAWLGAGASAQADPPQRYMVYSYMICAGVCPATILWLDGDDEMVAAEWDYRLPLDGRHVVARGPGLGPQFKLARRDVSLVLARITSGAALAPCDAPLEFNDTNVSVRVVEGGVCRHSSLSEAEYADFAALQCRLLAQQAARDPEPESPPWDPRCSQALPAR